jgi:hypothetical protein
MSSVYFSTIMGGGYFVGLAKPLLYERELPSSHTTVVCLVEIVGQGRRTAFTRHLYTGFPIGLPRYLNGDAGTVFLTIGGACLLVG